MKAKGYNDERLSLRTSLYFKFLQISVNQTFELFFVFEVAVGADLDFGAGWFIADDDAVGVHLDGADGPHVIDAFFYGVLQGACFVMAVAEDEDLAGCHDSADADSESLLRYLCDVVVEEAAVGNDGIGIEGLDAGLGGEGCAWLVEGDMSVGTVAAKEEVNTTV